MYDLPPELLLERFVTARSAITNSKRHKSYKGTEKKFLISYHDKNGRQKSDCGTEKRENVC